MRKLVPGRSAACSRCNSNIAFFVNGRGKWTPCNPDGSDHFDLCSKLVMERVKREGLYFDTKRAAGYKLNNLVKYTRLSADEIIGSRYRPDGCDCGLPPWELCKEGCQHAIQQ